MTTRAHLQVDWGFALKWTLATAGGWFVALTAAVVVAFRLAYLGEPEVDLLVSPEVSPADAVMIQLLSASIAGLIFGLAQWLVWRQRVQRAHRWIWASAIGVAATWIVYGFIPSEVGAGLILFGILFGAITALFQWLAFRDGRHLSLLWIPASSVAWAVGFGLTGVIQATVAMGFLMPGLIAGSITGLVLMVHHRAA
jgi:hypothetical protein